VEASTTQFSGQGFGSISRRVGDADQLHIGDLFVGPGVNQADKAGPGNTYSNFGDHCIPPKRCLLNLLAEMRGFGD
jgi:hypothetical protein